MFLAIVAEHVEHARSGRNTRLAESFVNPLTKLSLLDGELRTTVCWMLTPDDGKEKPEIGTDPLKQTDPTIRLQL